MDSMKDLNETKRVVIVGHVDHGKSTVIGRMIYDLDQVQDGKYEELKAISEKRGMSFEWAFLMDALQTERNQGITIDTTQIFFKTKKKNYVFIDAPGHREFLRNMVTGASSADIAILIVDVNEGIREQTRKHVYILKLLGVKQVIVLVNKMDKVNYQEEKFKKIEANLKKYLALININSEIIIPISAKEGDNIKELSLKMKWYNGFSLVDSLDNYNTSTDLSQKALRLPIQDIYKFNDNRILVGKIETGIIRKGDKILFSPSNTISKIKSIECWPKKNIKLGISGQCVGFTLEEEIFSQKGEIVSNLDTPPKLLNTFEANIFWLDNENVMIGRKYSIKITTGTYNIEFEKIVKVIDTKDLSKTKSNIIRKNDVAEVILKSNSLIPIDNFFDNESTGRFSIIDDYKIVGGGTINSTNFPDQRKMLEKNVRNITPVNFSITEIDRSSKFGHRNGIIWLTGLSGSGKSTLAKNIERRLFHKGYNIFVLDGDNLRNGLTKDLGFSPEDRMENIRRIAEVGSLFSYAGCIVIISLISPYNSERKKARAIRPEIFKEVYVKASLEKCIERDVKGLYAKAISGKIKNFTGLSAPYEEPESPDLVLDTESDSIESSINQLEEFIIYQFGKIKK